MSYNITNEINVQAINICTKEQLISNINFRIDYSFIEMGLYFPCGNYTPFELKLKTYRFIFNDENKKDYRRIR